MMRPLLRILLVGALLGILPHPALAAPASAPPGPDRPADPDPPTYDDTNRVRGEAFTSPGMFTVGLLPNPGFGIGAGLGFRWPLFSLSSEGRMFTTFEQPITGKPVTVLLGMMAFNGCFHVRVLYFCSGMMVGELRAQSERYHIITTHPWVMSGFLRAGAEWRYKGFLFLRGFGEAIISPVAPNIAFNDDGPAWQGGMMGGVMGIQLGLILGHPIKDEQ